MIAPMKSLPRFFLAVLVLLMFLGGAHAQKLAPAPAVPPGTALALPPPGGEEPYNAATFVSQSVPASMTAGSVYTVSVTMRNSGTLDWEPSAGYSLGSANPSNNVTWGTRRATLSTIVWSGTQYTFTFQVTAPAAPGTYNFQWQMQQENIGAWFGPMTRNVTVTVAAPPPVNNAAVIGQSVPAAMTSGQSYPVSVTMQNTGNTTWSAGAGYKLASQNPAVNTTWGPDRVALGASVAPGQQYTFSFNVLAPAPGGYSMQWQMLKEGEAWFGSTSSVPVTVNAPPPLPTLSLTRTPAQMVAGQPYTLSWSSSNATSLSHVCSAAGSGYNVNEALAVNGSTTGNASAGWVGYPSNCTWTVSGPGGSQAYAETMSTVAPAPTINVQRTPGQMTALQPYTLSWSTTDATSLTRVCTANGSGYTGNETLAVNGSSSGTAAAAWVNYPSTCTWTASGPGGSAQRVETMTTGAAAPTISLQRTPAQMTASQPYTLSWSTTDTTSLTRVCTASGTGYTGNETLAVNGSSSGTAAAAWAGYPSSCIWTASGPGGSTQRVETMTTGVGAPTISVQRTPAQMTALQPYTLTWSTTDAASLTRVCTASGSGYTGNETLAVNGSSSGAASAAWAGNPSTCTWTASGSGGTAQYTEVMTTIAAPADVVTYIHTDGLGSPVARTNASGNLIGSERFEPYGRTVTGSTPTIGFTGHVHDGATGLVYMQQRYYDPVAGRFLSIDPVTTDANTGSSFNRYAYANNNPYKYVDPDGRNPLLKEGLKKLAEVLVKVLVKTEQQAAKNAAKEVTKEGAKATTKEAAKVEAKEAAKETGKEFSKEKQSLVEMAKGDKKTGITPSDMKAYKDLNKELPDPFPSNKVRGPEAHSSGAPSSQSPHGHVGPVNHIPVIEP